MLAAYPADKTAILGLTRLSICAVDYAPNHPLRSGLPGLGRYPMRTGPSGEIRLIRQPAMEECRAMHPADRIATPAGVAAAIIFTRPPTKQVLLLDNIYASMSGLGH